MPIYERVTQEVTDLFAEVFHAYHGALEDAGLTVDMLFAKAEVDDNGDGVGPALKLHGYTVAVIAKIVSYKDRVLGHADAQIVFDGDRWDEWSDDEKRSLIDHELTHFELKVDKDGVLLRDDADRPKLKMRLHDHEFGWFDAIARRHGRASFEQQQAEDFFTGDYEQLWLPFAKGERPEREGPSTVKMGTGDLSVTVTQQQMKKLEKTLRRAASNG